MKSRTVWITFVIVSILVGGIVFAGNGDLIVNGNFNLLPAGTIVMYSGSSAPAGWLLADGSAVSRTTYAGLFAAIGTTYGAGDGSATFNLPDFRGVFPKGAGTTNRTAGVDASGNFYAGSLGAYSQDQMQGHKHPSPTNRGANPYGMSSLSAIALNGSSITYQQLPKNGPPISDDTNGNPRIGRTTEPQSLCINFIIKY